MGASGLRCRDLGSVLGSGRSPGEGSRASWSCLENPMGREARWRATAQDLKGSGYDWNDLAFIGGWFKCFLAEFVWATARPDGCTTFSTQVILKYINHAACSLTSTFEDWTLKQSYPWGALKKHNLFVLFQDQPPVGHFYCISFEMIVCDLTNSLFFEEKCPQFVPLRIYVKTHFRKKAVVWLWLTSPFGVEMETDLEGCFLSCSWDPAGRKVFGRCSAGWSPPPALREHVDGELGNWGGGEGMLGGRACGSAPAPSEALADTGCTCTPGPSLLELLSRTENN